MLKTCWGRHSATKHFSWLHWGPWQAEFVAPGVHVHGLSNLEVYGYSVGYHRHYTIYNYYRDHVLYIIHVYIIDMFCYVLWFWLCNNRDQHFPRPFYSWLPCCLPWSGRILILLPTGMVARSFRQHEQLAQAWLLVSLLRSFNGNEPMGSKRHNTR